MTDTPLPPGARIGILGGGQLGRMLSLAASRLGFKTHIYCPDPYSPAFDVTPNRTIAAYGDSAALEAFANAVDIVTYEFENVPVETARLLAARKPLSPGARALEIAQDRLAEKPFLRDAGIPVAPFRAVQTIEDLQAGIAELGLPAVLKTTRLGYDGKGQRMLRKPGDVEPAFAELFPGAPLVLEGFIAFEKEISVIVVRGANGEIVTYDPAENVHRDHILKTSTVPAAISVAVQETAFRYAETIVRALDYVGVLGVEFFVVEQKDGPGLLVNEIAPRVHNSGHWTEAVCVADQFENHIRAIAGWPLGDTRRLADVVMENLIGDEIETAPAHPTRGTRPHLYGKSEARPGRKMGHLNHIDPKRA